MSTLEKAASIVKKGDVSALKLLYYDHVVNDYIGTSPTRCTLLYLACQYGHLEIVKELVKCYGIDVNKSGVSIE